MENGRRHTRCIRRQIKKTVENDKMKVIKFQLRNGQKIRFNELTGLPNPDTDDETLKLVAEAAMSTDEQILSYEIIDEG